MAISLETIQPLLNWLQLHPYLAGLIVFLISLSESLAIIGLLIPGTVVMTAIGGLIGSGILPLAPTIAWAIAGAIAGDGISYWLGHHFHQHLRDFWPFNRIPKLLKKGEIFFFAHGGKSVFLGRFIGPIRPVIPVIAGMMNMSPLRFTLANISSAISWAILYMAPGIFLGALSQQLAPHVWPRLFALLLITLLLLWLFGWLLRRLITYSQQSLHQAATRCWQYIITRPQWQWLARMLTSQQNSTLGTNQLLLASLWLISLGLLIWSVNQYTPHSWMSSLNVPLLNFFASLRVIALDKIAVTLTLFSQPWLILSIAGIFLVGLLTLSYWRTSFYYAFGLVLAGLAIFWLKNHASVPQVSGFVFDPNFKLPACCCVLLSCVVLGNIFVMTSYSLRKSLLKPFLILLILISITPLYLQLSWAIDIVTATTFALFIVLSVALFYYRQTNLQANINVLLLGICFIAVISVSLSLYSNYQPLSKKLERTLPKQAYQMNTWWSLEQQPLVLYRQNRFGNPVQLLNVQWASYQQNIIDIMTKNGWQKAPKTNIAVILNRLTANNTGMELPLLPQVYLGHKANLIMTKLVDNHLLILRLWSTNTIIQPNNLPLWIGSISYHRGKHKASNNNFTAGDIAPRKLLQNDLTEFDWKRIPHPQLPCLNSIEDRDCDGWLLMIRPLLSRTKHHAS